MTQKGYRRNSHPLRVRNFVLLCAGPILALMLFGFLNSMTWAQDFAFTSMFGSSWRVACSGDGNIIVAASPADFIPYSTVCVSTNAGVTWSTNANAIWSNFQRTASLDCLALTPDANTLVAISGGMSWMSHDLGVTWNTNALPATDVLKVALSRDGTKWVCGGVTASGHIYVSDDSGASWRMTAAPTTNWSSVACSADGSRLAAVNGGSQVYTSPNRGLNWTAAVPVSTTNEFNLVACSADGNKVICFGDSVCVSTNAGLTWANVSDAPTSSRESGRVLWDVSASADASALVGFHYGGVLVYTSTNSGVQWVSHDATLHMLNIKSVATSTDGTRWFVGANKIYTWPSPLQVLSLAVGPNGVMHFSWLSNDVGFMLESAASFSPGAAWSTVTNPVYQGNYRFMVDVPVNESAGYFRLHKP